MLFKIAVWLSEHSLPPRPEHGSAPNCTCAAPLDVHDADHCCSHPEPQFDRWCNTPSRNLHKRWHNAYWQIVTNVPEGHHQKIMPSTLCRTNEEDYRFRLWPFKLLWSRIWVGVWVYELHCITCILLWQKLIVGARTWFSVDRQMNEIRNFRYKAIIIQIDVSMSFLPCIASPNPGVEGVPSR